MLLKLITYSLLGVAGLGVSSATDANAFESPEDGAYEDRVDWGVIMDLSGPSAASAVPWVLGFQDFIRKTNEAGGVHGRSINVLVEDDRYDASLHRIAYERLAGQTPALGLSGLGNSSAQAALMPAIREGAIPVLGTWTSTRAGLEPPSPMFYAGFCDYRSMAQVGVGFMRDQVEVEAPTVAVVHLDVASGVEYFDYVEEAIAQYGGTAHSLPIRVTAIDATPQILEISSLEPDFIAISGSSTTAITVLRAMSQYGLETPVFGGTYQGSPITYEAAGPEAGRNYYFISCLTPAGSDDGPALQELSRLADEYGHATEKFDVNYIGGWVVGQTVVDALEGVGPEPTRAALVEWMSEGFTVETDGISSPVTYTPDDHTGQMALRPYSYDYENKRFQAHGAYADYEQFLQ